MAINSNTVDYYSFISFGDNKYTFPIAKLYLRYLIT